MKSNFIYLLLVLQSIEVYSQKPNSDSIKDVIKTYTKTIKSNPSDLEAFILRAKSKYLLSDFRGSLSDYNKVIELYSLKEHQKDICNKCNNVLPDSVPKYCIEAIYAERARDKIALNKGNEAVLDLDEALSFGTNYSFALNLRGKAKLLLKDKNGACSDFVKASELGNTDAIDKLKEICNIDYYQQPDSLIKEVFYGLDLRLPNLTNSKILSNDKNFLTQPEEEPSVDRNYFGLFAHDYYGRPLSNGIIKEKSDSVILYFSSYHAVGSCNDCEGGDVSTSFEYEIKSITLEYYYHSVDSLEKAYNQSLMFFKNNDFRVVDATDSRYGAFKEIIFKHSYFITNKTLDAIKRYGRLISLPTLKVTRISKEGYCYLEINFEIPQIK